MTTKAPILVLAGVLLGGLFFQVLPQAVGDPDFATNTFANMGSVDSAGKFTVATGQMFGRADGEIIYIWNHELQRLAAYRTTSNALELLHVRNCSYDFKVQEFNLAGRRSVPSVEELKQKVQQKSAPPKKK